MKNKPKSLILLVCLCALFSFFDSSHILAQENSEYLASAVVHLVVTTNNGTFREGSGVLVSPDGVIFTAAHVVESASEIRVDLFDGFDVPPVSSFSANLRYISPYEGFDFAIIEIAESLPGTTALDPLNLPYIQSWSYVANVPEPIWIIGYPESADGFLQVTSGIIGATPTQPVLLNEATQDRYLFYYTDAVSGVGSSGGLVINAQNEFVGIPLEWELDQGGYVATILPISTICEIEPSVCFFEAPPPTPTPSSPIAGITSLELQQMLDENPEVQDMIDALDTYYMMDGNWQNGGTWDDAGIMLIGPAVFWTNIFDDVFNLPQGVMPIRTIGGWGVFKIDGGVTYTMSFLSTDGRYLQIVDELIPILSGGITEQKLQQMLNENPDVQDMIDALDTYYMMDGNWQNGGTWDDAGITLNGPAVFWTNIFDDVFNLPQGVVPIRTMGGWGVFRVNAGYRYVMPTSSTSGRYLMISTN